MEADGYRVILDSLPFTGVYVVREDDHRFLYFNQYIREVTPDIELGMVCHEVWTRGCENCPLLDIGNKKENRNIKYNSPFGEVVDIKAVRILWEGDIPAFVVMVTPHVEMANHAFFEILRGNLTEEACEVIQSEREECPPVGASWRISEYLSQYAGNSQVFEGDRERLWNFLQPEHLRRELREGRDKLSCSYRREADGELRWYMVEVVPDFRYTPEHQSVVFYTRDVHDLYQEGLERQEANIVNQERLAAVISSRYEIMNTVYLDTGICERIYLKGTGKDHKALQRDYQSYLKELLACEVHEEDRERFYDALALEQLRSRAREVEDTHEEILRYRIQAEGIRWMEAHILSIRRENVVVVYILRRDITEEKKAEEQKVREARERVSIINSLSRLFFAAYYVEMDRNRFRIVTSYGGENGLEGEEKNYQEEVLRYAREQVHPEERREFLETMEYGRLMEELGPERPYVAVEYRRIPKPGESGEGEWVRATAILAEAEEDGRPKTVLYVMQDVTALRQKEEEARRILKEAWEAATRANEAKSDFMSRMSHDIRTPLNAIIGMTTIAGMHLSNQERVEDCLKKIMVSSRHLLSLINEVLDMSKIESGKIRLAEESFKLPDLIQNVLTMIRPSAQAKEQELILRVVSVEHEDVIGDLLRLQQVFVNILGNSVKYTPNGGRLELEIEEKSSEEYGYGWYEFVFQDNGIGMDPEFQKRIFEPFSRAEDSRVSKIEGTGLGMAIVKSIVNLMNGTIQVESEKNKGTRFKVAVYLKQQQKRLDPEIQRLSGCRVLVADDDEGIREALCEMLTELGIKAEGAAGGREAVECYVRTKGRGEDYFAVILDWKMPGMDGLDAADEIRRLSGKKKPILVLAAYDWSRVEEDARKAGIDEFITKPVFKSHLVYLLRKLAGESGGADDFLKRRRREVSFANRRVLLVEDNELNREIAQELIREAQVEIEAAENGREALEMFEGHDAGYYDLIFMDIQMPVMNGHDASRAIRASGRGDAKSIPIIAMTANAFAEDILASQEAGMNEHISKPLDLDGLMRCMERWMP